jgi:heme exporter protein A
MIKINNLSFARGNSLILNNILVLKGANGKGKTTLLSNITNFLEPLEGEILYQGQKVESHMASEFFLYIGEDNFAYDNLSLKENIEYWLAIHNVTFSQDVRDKSIKYLFGEINLDKKFYQLSFGQKKKLQLLLLMLVNKPVWILDDPFNGLDKQSIKKITTLISKKAENKGIILLSSHQDIEINKHKTVNLK